MTLITKALPNDNGQEDFSDVEALVIHGPAWTNWLPWDAHARNVVLPFLRREKWHIRVSQGLRRVEAVTPWRPEALQ